MVRLIHSQSTGLEAGNRQPQECHEKATIHDTRLCCNSACVSDPQRAALRSTHLSYTVGIYSQGSMSGIYSRLFLIKSLC